MIKRVTLFCLCLSLFCVLCSCGEEKEKSPEELSESGQQYLQDNNHEEAVRIFKEVLVLDETNVDAYVGLAEAYDASDRIEDGISILTAGLECTQADKVEKKLHQYQEKYKKQQLKEAICTGYWYHPALMDIVSFACYKFHKDGTVDILPFYITDENYNCKYGNGKSYTKTYQIVNENQIQVDWSISGNQMTGGTTLLTYAAADNLFQYEMPAIYGDGTVTISITNYMPYREDVSSYGEEYVWGYDTAFQQILFEFARQWEKEPISDKELKRILMSQDWDNSGPTMGSHGLLRFFDDNTCVLTGMHFQDKLTYELKDNCLSINNGEAWKYDAVNGVFGKDLEREVQGICQRYDAVYPINEMQRAEFEESRKGWQ